MAFTRNAVAVDRGHEHCSDMSKLCIWYDAKVQGSVMDNDVGCPEHGHSTVCSGAGHAGVVSTTGVWMLVDTADTKVVDTAHVDPGGSYGPPVNAVSAVAAPTGPATLTVEGAQPDTVLGGRSQVRSGLANQEPAPPVTIGLGTRNDEFDALGEALARVGVLESVIADAHGYLEGALLLFPKQLDPVRLLALLNMWLVDMRHRLAAAMEQTQLARPIVPAVV